MKFLILFFLWGVVPVLLGERISNKKSDNIFFVYSIGICSELVLFHYIYFIFLGLDQPFHRLCYSYFAVLIIFMIVLLIRRRAHIQQMLLGIISEIRTWPWYIIIVVALVFFQCIFKINTMTRMALDDSEYVVCAVDAVYSDKMWYINPYTGIEGWSDYTIIAKRWTTSWIMYYAFVGKITGISVATVAHTIIPCLVIILANMIYTLLGLVFFDNDRKKTVTFLIILNWLFMNGWSTRDNIARSLLIFSWHGRTILYAIALPFLLYIIIIFLKKESFTWNDATILFIIVTTMICATTIGICFITILLPLIYMVYFIKHKKIFMGIIKTIFVIMPIVVSGIIYLYGRYIWNPF